MTLLDTARADLLSLLGTDTYKRVGRTDGGEYAGPCPFCGGRDRFRVWPAADHPRWWCRVCGEKGDALDLLQRRDHVSYKEACRMLDIDLADSPLNAPSAPALPPDSAEPPPAAWQDTAAQFIDQAARNLWDQFDAGATRALAWLRARGLSQKTIMSADLGYWPEDTYMPRADWGLPEVDGHTRVWLPRGIVIPWRVEDAAWKVQVRRPVNDEKKYYFVPGSTNALYNADALRPDHPAIIVEGSFDALAVQQAAGALIAPVAAGTTGARKVKWLAQLAVCRPVLVALDNDKDTAKGEKASAYWLEVLGDVAWRWRPWFDDPAAMLKAGSDLREWIAAGLENNR